MIPLHYRPPLYVKKLLSRHAVSIEELCKLAGIPCRASGAWIEQEVEIVRGDDIFVVAEPGYWGKVQIYLPDNLFRRNVRDKARIALAVLAYGMHNIVAKESIRVACNLGAKWIHLKPPPGRPVSGRALSNKERQKRFRAKLKHGERK